MAVAGDDYEAQEVDGRGFLERRSSQKESNLNDIHIARGSKGISREGFSKEFMDRQEKAVSRDQRDRLGGL